MSPNNYSTEDLTALIEALYAFISSVNKIRYLQFRYLQFRYLQLTPCRNGHCRCTLRGYTRTP